MSALPSDLRRQLESGVVAARRAAESAARAALDGLGVFVEKRPAHLDEEQARLRNGLRAKLRQLGNDREVLVSECAYEQWHRLLFARFLAENKLLLHPEFKAPLTLEDCDDLAEELGEPDGWSVAARFAAEILPGIFRLDDPCVQVRLAPEGRHALELILKGLPSVIFTADDALGWVYQFWQRDKKDEVNASERKIGGADLGPVTQLFTENYMVRFLLENSLGAWWASRHPDSQLVKDFDYLRFDDEGRPAAGDFEGWPERAAEVTVMDPCCGSGHFLVEAFSMLWQMRAEEEELDAIESQDAVLRDNLFGLELDPRCVQIAMFAVALQAWRTGGGWRQLPIPNIACSGIPVKAPVDEWKTLARGDQRLENALVRLHILFRDADTLGSLIDPRRATEIVDPSGLQKSFEDVDWEEVAPLLDFASSRETRDPATAIFGSAFASLARAASYMSRKYTLVCTNVPYLGKAKQTDTMRRRISELSVGEGIDLAMAWFVRMRSNGMTLAFVSPETWRFLSSYRTFRRWILQAFLLRIVVSLGAGAFRATLYDYPIGLFVFSTGSGSAANRYWAADCQANAGSHARVVTTVTGQALAQPHGDARILLSTSSGSHELREIADPYTGLQNGDAQQFLRMFWELAAIDGPWALIQNSTDETSDARGRSQAVLWENGEGALAHSGSARVQGASAWTHKGVAINRMGRTLKVTRYEGDLFDQNVAVLIPKDPADLPALLQFAMSPGFSPAVRLLDNKAGVTPGTLGLVPIDIEHWRQVAADAGSLPEPWSDDPTQWLFQGRPEASTAPLQVAVARLVGYRWPEQAESDDLNRFVDPDGIVCLPSVAGEPPAGERVQQLLATAYGDAWSPAKVKQLLEQAGSSKKTVADWLRDEFFKQHFALFGSRPFVWHIWDGQREGFSALVNYHRLDRKMLEKLTYTYLGQDWIERQRAEAREGIAGAEARVAAAQTLQRKLEAILEGEKPLDIYVRWKSFHEQPIGWEPDLNDGVRLNIRPFVTANVLRAPLNIHWRKDRGKNPDGSERHNDLHNTLAEKREARRKVGPDA